MWGLETLEKLNNQPVIIKSKPRWVISKNNGFGKVYFSALGMWDSRLEMARSFASEDDAHLVSELHKVYEGNRSNEVEAVLEG